MKRILLTSHILDMIRDIPELDISDIVGVEELGIKTIKDFSKQKVPILSNNYLIVLKNGEGIPLHCGEGQINQFIMDILNK